MKKWLQRTVNTAAIACGIALAAAGAAHADDGQSTEAADSPTPLTSTIEGLPADAAESRGMGADLVGSRVLGTGAVGGLKSDVTRPAEDLPLVGQLPVLGELSDTVPMGGSPVSADQVAPRNVDQK